MKKQMKLLSYFVFSVFIILPQLTFAEDAINIFNVSPGSTITVNQTLYFGVRVPTYTNPTYTVSDSFVGSTLKPTNINSSGNFGWTAKESDIGTHTITITVSDGLGHNVSTTQTVTVGTVSVSIQSLSPSDTIYPKQTVSFSTNATGFTNPVFNVTDSVINASAVGIGAGGLFSWTPAPYDAGEHVFTVRVTDSMGNSGAASQKITVLKPGLSLGNTKNEITTSIGNPVSFTVTANGLSNPVFTINDQFFKTSVSSTTINSTGVFNWTPTSEDRGTHYINIKAEDGFKNTSDINITIKVTFPTATTTTTQTTTQTSTQATTQNKYTFTKSIKIGSTGPEVTELQKKLTTMGIYDGPITGTFGPLTRQSVIKLQIKYNLEQVGSVGPGTRKILNN